MENTKGHKLSDQMQRGQKELMDADLEAEMVFRSMVASVHDEKGVNEESEQDAQEKIQQYLAAHNLGKAENEYLVRGAQLWCTCGSNRRKLNLNVCHGVYINNHAVVHEFDCVQGDEENITWFGACDKDGLDTEMILTIGDDGKRHPGKKCKPHIIGSWVDSYDGTKIMDNSDKMEDDSDTPVECNTLTVGSFLVCKHGGIIAPISSGQEREVKESEFVEGSEAFIRVVKS